MDPKSFIMGSSSPGFSFDRPGARITGRLTKDPELRQMKVWRNGKPTDELAFWPSGDPKMQLVISLETNFRNYEGLKDPDRSVPDDGRRTVYLNGKHREAALRQAVKAAGTEWMERGGLYDETYTGDDYDSQAGIKPKLAVIHYQAPPPGFNQPPAQTQQAQQPAAQGYNNGYNTGAQHAQQYVQPAQSQPQPPAWQQPGWRPDQIAQPGYGQPSPFGQGQVAVPSHHGAPENIPDWASPAPQSAPPAAPTSVPPAPPLSTMDLIRQGGGAVSDYGQVEPTF